MAREDSLTIRLTAEDRRALDEAARREDVPTAIVARRALKREVERLAAEQKKGTYRVQR